MSEDDFKDAHIVFSNPTPEEIAQAINKFLFPEGKKDEP